MRKYGIHLFPEFHLSMSCPYKLYHFHSSIGPLFVQENYLLAVPDEANHDKKKTMLLTSKAADSIAMGDLCEKAIRSQNAWSLLPTEAIFASVIPGEYMAGHVAGQIEFPKWLGMYSRQNKFDRILQELQVSSPTFPRMPFLTNYLLTQHWVEDQ
jgi:replication factor C subunit 1